MNPSTDLWSLPWHALQHRLANSPAPADRIAARRAASVAAKTPSWLERARAFEKARPVELTLCFQQTGGEPRPWLIAST